MSCPPPVFVSAVNHYRPVRVHLATPAVIYFVALTCLYTARRHTHPDRIFLGTWKGQRTTQLLNWQHRREFYLAVSPVCIHGSTDMSWCVVRLAFSSIMNHTGSWLNVQQDPWYYTWYYTVIYPWYYTVIYHISMKYPLHTMGLWYITHHIQRIHDIRPHDITQS